MKWQIMLISTLWLFTSCRREFSFERNGSEKNALDCNTVVHGDYLPGVALNDSNYLSAEINVNNNHSFVIYSDTVNGVFFRNSGTFKNIGKQMVVLKAYGAVETFSPALYSLFFEGQRCSFETTIKEAGYTLSGSGGNCVDYVIGRAFKAGQPTTIADSITLAVNVTKPGYYKLVLEETDGILFSCSGVFTHTGLQSVTVNLSGTPAQPGLFGVPIIIEDVNCTIEINVNFKSIDESMFYSFDAEGKHYSGYLDSAISGTGSTSVGILNVLSIGSIQRKDADTIFNLAISRINAPVEKGLYHSAIFSNEDYAGGVNYSVGYQPIYLAPNDQAAFEIKLSELNMVTRLVEGEFYGPVLNSEGKPATVTNGHFRSYMSH